MNTNIGHFSEDVISPIPGPSQALARWLAEREPENGDALATIAAVLGVARSEGHTGASLSELTNGPLAEALAEAGIRIGDVARLRADLASSRLVGKPDELTPIILDGDLVFYHRFFEGERRIAEDVRSRSRGSGGIPATSELRALADKLFDTGDDEIDWQAIAGAAALRSRFLCIAGGPGTGKTSTVTRILALLLTAAPDLRIALAAPTGKAANRMAESIRLQVAGLAIGEDLIQRMPHEASTLHRLLGYNPSRARFAYGEERKLEADVVIVDEASMIDHELFAALLAALDEDARLILLGDPDQLPSVEAGFVFGSICRAAEGEAKSRAFVSHLDALGITPAPAVSAEATSLQDAVITLTHGHRFGPDSGIGTLAYALRDGRQADIRSILASGHFLDIEICPHEDQKRVVRTNVRTFAREILGAESAEAALRALDRLRVLSPVRVGPRGVEALNEDLESWLFEEEVRPWGSEYQGKPLLVTSNDYEVSLFNGDVGVLWKRADGSFAGCFPGASGVREVAVSRLPAHEVAWAMTVHKSQGSEFDHVILVLPEQEDSGRLTRELLYTAVTRARKKVTIIGDIEVLVEASTRRERRITGLSRMLETGSFMP